MKKNRIVGIITQGELLFSFVCQDHHFTFMRIGCSPVLGVTIILKAINGFIEGKTSDDKKILIFTNGDIEINNTKDIYTWLYFIAKDKYQQLRDYDGIKFIDALYVMKQSLNQYRLRGIPR